MKKSILSVIVFVFLTVLASGCVPASTSVPASIPPTLTSSPMPPTSAPEPASTTTAMPASWEVYVNETWKFSLEYPASWVVTHSDTESGFIGKQVFWWVGDYDPLQQHGDVPSIDEMTELDIAEQPARRVTGYYQGAIGDMGLQQYLRYVIRKENIYYTFTLYAIDALGIPASMMTERQPLRENDVELFERMIATLDFDD